MAHDQIPWWAAVIAVLTFSNTWLLIVMSLNKKFLFYRHLNTVDIHNSTLDIVKQNMKTGTGKTLDL